MSSGFPDRLAMVRSDLRYLVLAQYAYFADHQTYAEDLGQLMAATDYRMLAEHEGEVSGDSEGFTATVRWTQSPGPPDRGTIWIGDHARRADRLAAVIYCE